MIQRAASSLANALNTAPNDTNFEPSHATISDSLYTMSGSMGLRTNHGNVGLELRINQGQILFLKGEEFIGERAIEESEIERGAFGHPVLILELDIDYKHARICVVSQQSKLLSVKRRY